MLLAEVLTSSWLMPAIIFFARIADVSMGTVRTICVVRGQRFLAVVFGFVEVLIWMFAVSSVLARLDHWPNILAYAAGYAAGNAIGMGIEGKLALGIQALTFVSRGRAGAVAQRLQSAGHWVTTLSAESCEGPISVCRAIVNRKLAREAIRMTRQIDPEVLVTVEDVREFSAVMARSVGPGKMPLPCRGSPPSTLLRRVGQSMRRKRPDPPSGPPDFGGAVTVEAA